MIEVITGPMYSGKTEELIRRLTRAKIGGKSVIAFKPEIDNRYGEEILASHSGIKIDCLPLDLDSSFTMKYDVVGIDEAQFFDDRLIGFVRFLSSWNVKVIIAGLDMTYRKEPFGSMPTLMAISSDVIKLKAVCQVCGDDAAYTQRVIQGKPASFEGPTIQIGAFDSYEARCYYCWEAGKE
jgi:thymidine kinase